MLNSGKKFPALPTKKINILTLVLFERNILNETKNHNPPALQLNGRSLRLNTYHNYYSLNNDNNKDVDIKCFWKNIHQVIL